MNNYLSLPNTLLNKMSTIYKEYVTVVKIDFSKNINIKLAYIKDFIV